MSILQATYFDGKRSSKHAVSIIITGGLLKIIGREVNETFDAKGVRRSLRVGNTPRWLYLPGGGACMTADNEAVDRMTRDRRYERLLHVWESRPAYAAIAIALVAAAVWVLFDRVVPKAVDAVATRIPVQTEQALGEQTLNSLDQAFLQPSKLPEARQTALRNKFDAMARTTRDATPYRLEFRASPVVGPNAFALPSGIIVMTDELVKYSNNDHEVLGVLAHELGHVHHRHTMRRLLEGSATALIIAGITGDVASATSLAAAAPGLLLQTKYSRDNEREADRYAIDMMRKVNYNPGHLAAILGRMSAKGSKRGGLPTFLSSHPPTEEREALARAGTPDAVREQDAAQVRAENAQVAALVPDKPKLNAIDPAQREILTLLTQQDIAGLERVLGGYQQAFEADAGASVKLENAFRTFRKVPRSAEGTITAWVKSQPTSYVALLARASFYTFQGLEARGNTSNSDTPEENMRTMRILLEKAQTDLQRSLTLTPKPYVSRLILMLVTRTTGELNDAKAHYLEAVKLAPQSVELRITHISNLSPQWGGSYDEMDAFAAASRKQLTDPKAADRVAARIPASRGQERMRQHDPSKALGFYNEAVALDASASADLLCSRARVQSELHREIEALADVKQALTITRDNRVCLDHAIWLATRSADTDEALTLLNLVLEVDSNNGNAFVQRGWRHEKQQKRELAFQDYLAAAKLDDGWGQMMTGRFLWSGIGVKPDRDEGLAWLRKAAEKGHPEAKQSLQQALEQLGQK
jgi:Zn-dependent protease with chaperone function